jgi:hypothetical protein
MHYWVMADTYYRLHQAGIPEFSADNAWSGLWGGAFSADGSRSECGQCDAKGVDEWGEPCEAGCSDGWFDCAEGYSCCWTGQDLLRYFDEHLGSGFEDEPVVVFEGALVGTGFDGEPLAIPTRVIRWTTIGQLREEIS